MPTLPGRVAKIILAVSAFDHEAAPRWPRGVQTSDRCGVIDRVAATSYPNFRPVRSSRTSGGHPYSNFRPVEGFSRDRSLRPDEVWGELCQRDLLCSRNCIGVGRPRGLDDGNPLLDRLDIEVLHLGAVGRGDGIADDLPR